MVRIRFPPAQSLQTFGPSPAPACREDLGIKLENVTLDMLGRAKRVVIEKENTTIIDGAGDKDSPMSLGRIVPTTVSFSNLVHALEYDASTSDLTPVAHQCEPLHARRRQSGQKISSVGEDWRLNRVRLPIGW